MSDNNSVKGGEVRAAMGVGMASLVTVLVAVLLTTFSVLALVSARADLHLSNKAAASMEAYYAADSAAESWLASLATTHGEPQEMIFAIDENRDLIVQVTISDNGAIDILKWQVTAKELQ